jgi:hypothetical protein
MGAARSALISVHIRAQSKLNLRNATIWLAGVAARAGGAPAAARSPGKSGPHRPTRPTGDNEYRRGALAADDFFDVNAPSIWGFACDRHSKQAPSGFPTRRSGQTVSSTPLSLRYGRIGLPGMLGARRIDIGPRARTSGPNISGNLHVGWVVERSGPQHSGLGGSCTLAVDGRPAVTAEVAMERASAVGSDDVSLRLTVRNVQG